MDKQVHQVRLAQWSQRIMDRKASGLTIAKWCEENGFTKDTYHYWQSRVRKAALAAVNEASSAIVPANNSIVTSESSSFAELPQPHSTVLSTPACSSVSVNPSPVSVTIRRGSTVIEIANGTDSHLLSFINEVIRNA